MAFTRPSTSRAKTIAIYVVISLILAIILFNTVGAYWAFLGLFALWVSGHTVAWFKRHPPPPHKRDD